MATILTKKSDTGSAVPLAADLTNAAGGAELAVNTSDKRLFTKNSGGTVVELGINPSSLTMSGGTANGVAYLNGSKVVTSGSALTFDGTSLANTQGGGTATLQFNELSFSRAGANYLYATQNTLNYGGTQHIWFNNTLASEWMRLTSTGLGIGTSSPSAKLGVAGNVFISGATPYIAFDTTQSGSTPAFIQYASSALVFGTGSAEKMRLDSSGNLGLGGTPSAWATSKAIQIGNRASIFSFNNLTVDVGNNVYFNGSDYKYIETATATFYRQNTGSHAWLTAASGTAGNAITFTQAMTLTSAGNLVIGTTSDSGNSLIRETILKSPSNGVARTLVTTNSGVQAHLGVSEFSSANVGFVGTLTNNPFQFLINDSEKARIDTSGNLLVGTASSSGKITVYTSGGVVGQSIQVYEIAPTIMQFKNSQDLGGSITIASGGTTSYNTSSDYRLKNTIAPMTGALAKVALLKPCTYKWNADGSDGEGFIAHELAEVCPHAVTGEKDAVDEDGNPKYQGIDTSFLVATLTAAIQELKAEFDAYKASHP